MPRRTSGPRCSRRSVAASASSTTSPRASRLTADPYDLERFVTAQEPVYGDVLAELRQGRKTSHWMWFIFPQVAGLGHSPMSERYAIRSLVEARAYLAHPLLGARLQECAGLVHGITDRTAEEVFGPIDARKLRSSMTLFHRAAPAEPIFRDVLRQWFGDIADPMTDALLER